MSIRTLFPLLIVVAMPLALAACETSSDVTVRYGAAQPRQATWRCTGGATLRISNLGSTLEVVDSRGPEVTLPPDPPGQRERYGKTGYALVFDGRNASWFAGGHPPTDCRR